MEISFPIMNILLNILYGLCVLLICFNFKGFVRYAFAGCGVLWIVSIFGIFNINFSFLGKILSILACIAIYTPSLTSKLKLKF